MWLCFTGKKVDELLLENQLGERGTEEKAEDDKVDVEMDKSDYEQVKNHQGKHTGSM